MFLILPKQKQKPLPEIHLTWPWYQPWPRIMGEMGRGTIDKVVARGGKDLDISLTPCNEMGNELDIYTHIWIQKMRWAEDFSPFVWQRLSGMSWASLCVRNKLCWIEHWPQVAEDLFPFVCQRQSEMSRAFRVYIECDVLEWLWWIELCSRSARMSWAR